MSRDSHDVRLVTSHHRVTNLGSQSVISQESNGAYVFFIDRAHRPRLRLILHPTANIQVYGGVPVGKYVFTIYRKKSLARCSHSDFMFFFLFLLILEEYVFSPDIKLSA